MNGDTIDATGAAALIDDMARRARTAAHDIARASAVRKSDALIGAAATMRRDADAILTANAADMAAAQNAGLSAAMLDRLKLTPERLEGVAAAVDAVAALRDPVGRVIDETARPNGLRLSRVRVPIGVIGIIYESRPNVTADAGAIALKSGNACILRGGSEARRTNAALHDAMTAGLRSAGLSEDAIQLVPTTSREVVGAMLGAQGLIDIIVPRGGRTLVERVAAEARVPVLAHLEGICHTYIDRAADPAKAREISVNAKMRRTGVCGATETLLIDQDFGGAEAVFDALIDAGCALRGDARAVAMDPRITPASDADWTTEYLDAVLAVRFVDGVDGAMEHIARHGSHHTDAIVTEDMATAERFLAGVDSAIVMHNASTQFADGGEFGLGAEIGIATGRLHARGPVALEGLTTYKWVVRGTGQVRP